MLVSFNLALSRHVAQALVKLRRLGRVFHLVREREVHESRQLRALGQRVGRLAQRLELHGFARVGV
jgi:hypothetical protein